MNTLLLPSAADSTTNKRFKVSWSKKNIPLKHSALFNKAKHSEEWHQAIDEIAGVLHPSDPKFPYIPIRQATEVYLKKKGRISREDVITRLSILIDAHDARDIAIAATSHIITATSLRTILQAGLNVTHGSYWGLEIWLQCLIAANHGNPASVTDLEAFWARNLLPFATHGQSAAGRYLEGVSRLLRADTTPNLSVVPEFLVLVHRALSDFAMQLEGLRLKCNWVVAHAATSWMVDLSRTAVITTPGSLLPEHILNSSFPVWEIWACWRPDVDRIIRLRDMDRDFLAVLPDILALEGPDFVTGKEVSLREGLIMRYAGKMGCVKFQGLIFEVPDCTRDGLRVILERLSKALDFVCAGTITGAPRKDTFEFFTALTVTRPITTDTLGLLEAVFAFPCAPENEIYSAVREIYTEKDELGGSHISALRKILHSFVNPHAEDLRRALFTPWLIKGIVACFEDCRIAIKTHINQRLPWSSLALEFHGFCTALEISNNSVGWENISVSMVYLPPLHEIEMAIDIYEAACAQRPRPLEDDVAQIIAENKTSPADSINPASALFRSLDDLLVVRHPLEEAMEAFYTHHLLDQGKGSYTFSRSTEAIFKVWKRTSGPTIDTNRRSLAILISKISGIDDPLCCRCLEEIASTHQFSVTDVFTSSALRIMQTLEKSVERSFVDFTMLLSQQRASGKILSQCWRDFVYRWLELEPEPGVPSVGDLMAYLVETMGVVEWFQFMKTMETLFVDRLPTKTGKSNTPPILQSLFLDWKERIADYMNTLVRLEAALGKHSSAMHCILSCESTQDKNNMTILICLRQAEGKVVEPLLQRIVGDLSSASKNAWEVSICVSTLKDASEKTFGACMKVWDAKNGVLDIPGPPVDSEDAPTRDQKLGKQYDVPISVVEVMVAGYMQDVAIDDLDKVAVHSLACLLKVKVYNFNLPKDVLAEATRFWGMVHNDIIKEVERLESLQMALMAEDPEGTAALLEQLGVSNSTWIDEEITSLPDGIYNLVTKTGDSQVEILFPLSVYSHLHRSAMGIPTAATTLVVRVTFERFVKYSTSFCIHYNNETGLEDKEHSPYVCYQDSQSPSKSFCDSTQTAFTLQLGRILHREIELGNTKILSLHDCVTKTILGRVCVSCCTPHKIKHTNLRRSIPCDVWACTQLWYKLPLEVRIPEIRNDTFAVDLMLTAVYAAAVTGVSELLPGCPFRDHEVIKRIMDALPSMSIMRDAVNLSAVLSRYHSSAEKLISWACVHHRGFIATATGVCKIPNLPWGTHQFVLANASPRLESDFMSRLPRVNIKTTVLFHGTSLNRLPAILSQGLRVCSGTSLQRIGAAHGKGIYLASEPNQSINYSPTVLTWKNSGLTNMRLLLGCEVLGNAHKEVTNGIHLVTDPASVMAKYALLFPVDSRVPTANQVIHSMATSMRKLRAGEV
jgi:hypothetical protein